MKTVYITNIMNAVLKAIYNMQVGNDNDIIIVIKLWLYTSLIYELEFWMYSVKTRLPNTR